MKPELELIEDKPSSEEYGDGLSFFIGKRTCWLEMKCLIIGSFVVLIREYI